jgi:hypothetical protein
MVFIVRTTTPLFCDEQIDGVLNRTYAGVMKFMSTLFETSANVAVTRVFPVCMLEMYEDASPLLSVVTIDGVSVANVFD